MPNTNAQAVKIANTRLRVEATKLARLFHYTKIVKAQGEAEGWPNLYVKDDDVIDDKADQDGRTPITNAEAKQLIAAVDDVITFFDSDPARRDLILRMAVDPEQL